VTDYERSATAAALLLDGWTCDGAVGAKHAAVAALWLKQPFAVGAFVKIHARIGRHGLLPLVTAIRASQQGFENGGCHGVEMSFDGNPASVVA
jgi:hypothetical protein